MNHSEFSFLTTDGINLFAQSWCPEGEVRGVVCLVHGLGEHSGRYAHVGVALCRAGYALAGFDLRGHGKSGGPRGHTPSYEAYLDDIALFLAEADRLFPGIPQFLYGHSMGGLLVLSFVLRRQTQVQGVIVTAPALITPIAEQKLKISFAKLAGSILPALTLPSGLNPQDISRVPEVVQAYRDDPLVHDRTTLAMAKSTIQAMPWVFEHARDFTLPMLVMHGSADRLVYVRGSEQLAEMVSCECDLKIWPGLHHEIHNEPEKEQVLAYLIDWLDRHLPGNG
jgi:alpha-beta hydrolase superfamily lysophospholipase